MRNKLSLYPLLVVVSFTFVGCGQSNGTATSSHASSPSASQTQSPSQVKSAATTQQNAESSSPATESKPAALPSDLGSNGAPTRVPATAAELLAVIDLRTLPRINETRVLEEGPTHVHYSAKTTIAGADAFCSAELASRGWKPAPGEPMVTEQYADRLFEKEGFYVRLSMGAGADEGVAGISLYHLGNVDMRSFPRLGNADIVAGSTPVNANYQTDASLADATKYCREQLTKLGWREFGPMHDSNIEVPHAKHLTWLHNATRLDVIVAKPFDKPASPTTVAYMALHGLPFDLPVMTDATAMKLDLYSGRAEYVSASMPEQVFAFYKSTGERLGWQPRKDGTHVQEKSASLIVEDQPEKGFGIAIARREKNTTVSLTRLSLKDEPAAAEAEESPAQVAATGPSKTATPAEPTIDPVETAVENAAAEVLQEVNKSLKGDLADVKSELGKLGVKIPGGLLDDEPKSPATVDSPVDSSVEADTETPSAADLNLPKLQTGGEIVFDNSKYPLKHAVAYRVKESDEMVPVVVLSEQPVDAEKVSRLLSSGKEIWLSDLFGFKMPAAIQIRLGKHQTSVSAFVDGASINISSSDAFQTEFKVIGKRLRGTVDQREPQEFFDKEYLIKTSFDLEMIAARSAVEGATEELVADSNHELPVPEGTSSVSQEGGKYRQSLNAEINQPVEKVAKFYRRELARLGWKDTSPKNKAEDESFAASFTGPQGSLKLALTKNGDGTTISLSISNKAAAKKDGLLPPAGKALVALGNAGDTAVVFTVNGKDYKLEGGSGKVEPAEAVKIEVPPGKHIVRVKMADGQTSSEEINAEAGTAWGALALPPDGVLAMQVY